MPRAFIAALLLLVLQYGSPAVAETETSQLDRINFLIKNHAPDLALRMLSGLQPDPADHQAWMEWERLRFTIYRKTSSWDALIKRLDSLPSGLPTHFVNTLLTQGAELLLDSGRSQQVRRYVRKLMWNGSYDPVQAALWRRLAIQSYLSEGLLDDAQLAMRLYQREFLPNDSAWSLLYAGVLLRAGFPAQAASYLATSQSGEGRLLRLLSRLRSRTDDPATVIEQAKAMGSRLVADTGLRAGIWALSAEAALYAGDLKLRAEELERVYQEPQPAILKGLFEYDVDQLWQAYVVLGEQIGNVENLLIGDDKSWLLLAESFLAEESVKARSIYALLSERTNNPAVKEAQYVRLYSSLKQSNRVDTAMQLFADKQRFPTFQEIPKAVRFHLVNQALAKRNLKLAGEMAIDLDDIDQDVDHFDWALKRARLAIYSGKFDSGVGLLGGLIDNNMSLDKDSIDRILQVIFDLQAVDYHRQSYALLDKLYTRATERGQQREILFWMADALRGDQKYDSAVERYFRSAVFEGDSTDMWGQTARYEAAETLQDAGFKEDAKRVYESLLKDTTNPQRRAILERAIQKLLLADQKLFLESR